MRPVPLTYASREALASAYDITEVARASAQLDRCLRSATDSIEALTHRVFYPEHRTMTWDYPDWFAPYRTPWVLRLDDNEMISADEVTSGGQAVTDYFLRPDDGPPFTRLEVDLSSGDRFASGDTHQRSISVEGVYGYREQWQTVAERVFATTIDIDELDLDNGAGVGVGDLIRIDDEWMAVRDKAYIYTGTDLSSELDETTTAVEVGDGSELNTGEIISIGSERMQVTAVTGNTATVLRAWDGTQLATHSSGTNVFALRQVIVNRGVLGTEASTHNEEADVDRFVFPPLITDLCIAEAMVHLTAQRGGFIREAGINTDALDDLRKRTYRAFGRKARTRAV